MQGSAAKRLVIIAGSQAQLLGVPFEEPRYEIWGLNATQVAFPRWDRWFELHDDFREQNESRPGYAAWLQQDHGRPVYMIQEYPDVPSSVRYPLNEIEAEFGVAYWCNSFAYMVALAVFERVDGILVYGMNEADRDRCERAWRNISFWLGVAKGRGIRVWVHPDSEFLRSFHGDAPGLRYGYGTAVPGGDYCTRRMSWSVDRSAQEAGRRAFRWGLAIGVVAAIGLALMITAGGGVTEWAW